MSRDKRQVFEELISEVRRSQNATDRFDQAVALFTEVALADDYVEFLTLPAYERMP